MSLTLNEAREALYQAFVDGWADRTDYIFGGEDQPKTSSDWARFSVQHFPSGGQETLNTTGNRDFQRRGRIFLQIFTPRNDPGQRTRADGHAQKGLEIFEGTSISGIEVYDGSAREAPPDNQWSVTLVECSFWYTETK